MKAKRASIKKLSIRITVLFSVVVILAFIAFVLVIGSFFSKKLSAEMDMLADQRLGLVSAMLDNSLSDIKNLYFSLIESRILQEQMQKQNSQNDDEKADLKIIMSECERLSQKKSSGIRSIVFVDERREILNPIYAVPPYNRIVEDNPEFDNFLSSQLSCRFSSPSTFPITVNNPHYSDRNTITMFGHYYDSADYSDLGYVAINLTKYSVFGDIEKSSLDDFSMSFILDEYENIVFQTRDLRDASLLTHAYAQGEQAVIDDRTYLVYTKKLQSYYNWRIVGLIDYETIAHTIRMIYLTILLVAVAAVTVIVLLSFYIANRITNPLSKINSAMSEVGKGLHPPAIQYETDDEIGKLAQGFNSMVESLENLTSEVAAKQEEKKEYEVAIVRSQLDLLQSQINPHFIHNTLNTMKYMAIQARADSLTQMIVQFNMLLRTSMSQDVAFITLREEIENLHCYMEIQRARYDVDIGFDCDTTEEALKVMLPKLVLQPLVENSLFHGIIPNGGGKIAVNARPAEGRLWITVWDDGVGIPEDKLEQIQMGNLPNPRGYNKIGLANVKDRLVLYYGEASRIVLQNLSEGTSIGFSIPINHHRVTGGTNEYHNDS